MLGTKGIMREWNRNQDRPSMIALAMREIWSQQRRIHKQRAELARYIGDRHDERRRFLETEA